MDSLQPHRNLQRWGWPRSRRSLKWSQSSNTTPLLKFWTKIFHKFWFLPEKRHPWDSSTHQLHVNERQNPKLPFLTPCIKVKWKEPSSFLVTLDIQGVLCFEVSTSIYTYYIHGCPPLAKHSGCTRNEPLNSLGMLTFAFFKNNIMLIVVVM